MSEKQFTADEEIANLRAALVDMPPFHMAHGSFRVSNLALAQLLAAASASGGVDGWMPIETAPKDGTYILIAEGDFMDIAKWWMPDYGPGYWGDIDGTPSCTPTHWRPRPPPPTVSSRHSEEGGHGALKAYLDERSWKAGFHACSVMVDALETPPSPDAPPPVAENEAPGHTDLMVSPESIDAFLEANPPPADLKLEARTLRDNLCMDDDPCQIDAGCDCLNDIARALSAATPTTSKKENEMPPLTVWKYPLILELKQVGLFPAGARPLHVGLQSRQICLWALVNPEAEKVPMDIIIVETGGNAPSNDHGYVGTIHIAEHLIFHVWVLVP